MKKWMSVSLIIGAVVALLLIGILLPIGLQDIVDYNGTYTVGTVTSRNATVGTIVGTILPIMAVIALVLAFVPKSGNRDD
jgi:fumarate reductase subunit D